jgi:hypothetical protein
VYGRQRKLGKCTGTGVEMTDGQVANCDQIFYLATRYLLKEALVATDKK